MQAILALVLVIGLAFECFVAVKLQQQRRQVAADKQEGKEILHIIHQKAMALRRF